MPVLELVMDNSQFARGAVQAESSLKGVQDAAVKTQSSVTGVGGSLRNTFQAVQGVSQVGQGINSTAQAFGNLNLAMGAFAASRTLLEIGKTSQDFREMAGTTTVLTKDVYGMTTATTRAASGWAVLGAAIRTHPLLTVATLLGAAASAMAIFGSSTRSAAASWDDLATAMKKARLDERTSQFLGLGKPTDKDRLGGIYSATTYALQFEKKDPGAFDRGFNVQDFARTLGISMMEVMRDLVRVGNPQAAEYMRTGQYTGGYRGAARFGTSDVAGELQMTPQQQLDILRARYRYYQDRAASSGDPVGAGAYGASGLRVEATQDLSYSDEARTARFRESGAEEHRRRIEMANQKQEEAMARSAAYAEQVGASLGGAMFDVLAGIASWRQALLSIVQSFAKQGLQELGANLFKSTATQLTK